MTAETLPPPARLGLPWERGSRPALTGNWWVRGLCLTERAACAGSALPAPAGTDLADRAGRRLERWRTAYPELTDDVFAGLPQTIGVTAREAHDLLAEPYDRLHQRAGKPDWATRTEQVVAAMSGEPEPFVPASWHAGFDAIVAPFVDDAARRWSASERYRQAAAVADLDAIDEQLRRSLAGALIGIAARTLVLELHVFRVQGRLAGDTPVDRFRSFVTQLRRPDGLANLLDEYAVLSRGLATAAEHAVVAGTELVGRFVADRDLLVGDVLGGTDPGRLIEIHLGDGDVHDRGRAVALLRFDTGARLVYKPRPLGVHTHFNQIVDWYNDRLPAASLRQLTVCDRGDYGWVEFVEPRDCADHAAAERYFFRLGTLLALLHGLSAVDFHFENLIACDDQPVLVDLESLFHVQLPPRSGQPFLDDDPAQRALAESVQTTGLLPSMVFGPDGQALDLSAMGGDKGSVLPFKSVSWDDPGTDQMRLARTYRQFAGSQNRPRLDGQDLDVVGHRDELLAGFRDGYRTLRAFRDELTGPHGLLSRVANDQTRTIVRPTRQYMQLLTESTHPDVGRDALERDRVFSLLLAHSTRDPRRQCLVRNELTDLWAGDVPLFRSRAGSRDLWSSDGTRIAGVLPESGLDRAGRILSSMSDQDLDTQLWIITASLVTRAPSVEVPGIGSAPATSHAALPARAMAQACRIADELERTAYRNHDRVGWLGASVLGENQWTVQVIADDLYNGYSGVGMFLAQLAHLTGRREHVDLARSTLAPLVEYLPWGLEALARADAGDESPTSSISAFEGPVSVAIALYNAAVLLDDDRLAAPVRDALEWAATVADRDTGLDIVAGAAGCLAVAESLVEPFGATAARLAERCAGRLVEKAEPVEGGLAWHTTTGSKPLLGFSHGAAGMGWALLRHAARTGNGRCRAVGLAALDYEHGQYREHLANWPDYRDAPETPWRRTTERPEPHQRTWCHGAPGVGLARADLVRSGITTPGIELALRRAMTSTAEAPEIGNHSLCHGDLGNLELFRIAADADIDGAEALWRDGAARTIERLEQSGPRCGTPGGIDTPGLMSGMAGIGHGLLRIAAPERISPVLLLAGQH